MNKNREVVRIEVLSDDVNVQYMSSADWDVVVEKPPIDVLNCNYCYYKARNEDTLIQHHVITHSIENETKWYKCQFCAFTTTLPRSLRTHEERSHGVKVKLESGWYECPHCSFQSCNAHEIHNHMGSVHSSLVKLLKCFKCDFETYHHMNLNLHLSKKHQNEENLIAHCTLCGFVSKTRTEITEHMKTHM